MVWSYSACLPTCRTFFVNVGKCDSHNSSELLFAIVLLDYLIRCDRIFKVYESEGLAAVLLNCDLRRKGGIGWCWSWRLRECVSDRPWVPRATQIWSGWDHRTKKYKDYICGQWYMTLF